MRPLKSSGNWVKTRQRSVTSAGFQMKQEEDGMDAGHNTEIYGWIALSAGTGSISSTTYEALVTPDVVVSAPPVCAPSAEASKTLPHQVDRPTHTLRKCDSFCGLVLSARARAGSPG